jgi:hypothetical protein
MKLKINVGVRYGKLLYHQRFDFFLWCLPQRSLPTADFLEYQHMETTGNCVNANSWRHSLVECNTDISVWALMVV